MENTRTMAIQMPEETYQRLKAYLKRHKVAVLTKSPIFLSKVVK